ncbi:MAG: flagellar biosynthesis anti-sigma factor FlgM [Sulfurimonas sp.]|nr:flagellar biosynthesis anti-sigma factor FlgM [Sulfurimonas sp.]
MISQTNGSVVSAAYQNKSNTLKEQKLTVAVSSSHETSKVDELKKSIDSGEYKVDLNALSQKMADALL